MDTKLLINGKIVRGLGAAEKVLDPATGKVIATVPEASTAQVDAAVQAAAQAFDGWSRTPPKDRAALLLKLADRIEADGKAYAGLESRNCGKPLAAVLGDEIPAIADVFRFFAGAARTLHGAVAGEYAAGFTSSPCTCVPSRLVDVNSSVIPSWTFASHSSLWRVRRRSAPFSSACTSAGCVAVAASTAKAPSGPCERLVTTRGPATSFSTLPLSMATRAGCCDRSSTTPTTIARPSGVNTGERTGRSSAPARIREAPPVAGTTASRGWLYAEYFSSSLTR